MQLVSTPTLIMFKHEVSSRLYASTDQAYCAFVSLRWRLSVQAWENLPQFGERQCDPSRHRSAHLPTRCMPRASAHARSDDRPGNDPGNRHRRRAGSVSLCDRLESVASARLRLRFGCRTSTSPAGGAMAPSPSRSQSRVVQSRRITAQSLDHPLLRRGVGLTNMRPVVYPGWINRPRQQIKLSRTRL
jgi:hypothetical protein